MLEGSPVGGGRFVGCFPEGGGRFVGGVGQIVPLRIPPPTGVKCTPKVRQNTFGVYYVKEETNETLPIRLSPFYASDRRRL